MRLTVTVNLIVRKGTSVGTAIRPDNCTLSTLNALYEVTFEEGSVGPLFFSLPVLLIVKPFAGEDCSDSVSVNAVAVRLVILPASFINVSICMDHSPLCIGHVVLPVAFVRGAIWPDLDALALAHFRVDEPLARVANSAF